MRTKISISALFLFCFLTGFAQIKGPEAYLSYASYNTPSGQSYFETYLTVKARTVMFGKNANNQYQCKVKISVQFSQGDSVKLSDAYNLLSRETTDTTKKFDFIGVKRYWLAKGEYVVLMKIEGVNNPNGSTVSVSGKVNVGSSTDSLAISDAEMIVSYTPTQHSSMYTKSGYDLVPYVYNFYPQSIKSMNFYVELYNTMKVFAGSKFAVQYSIQNADTHTPLNSFISTAVYSPDSVIPILGGFNIEKLATGKYELVVAIIDKNKKTLQSRSFSFYRNNAVENFAAKLSGVVNMSGTFVERIRVKDTLLEDVKCLNPIANMDERAFIEQVSPKDDTALLRRFLYTFWLARSPGSAEQAWLAYYAQVKLVNKLFTTINKKGYQSDRGRVYLQYGAPTQRDKETINPVSYPYEIWEYYKMNDGETDKKFIFYEPSLATNDFILLHSTARGEVQNRQWQMVLYKQTVGPYSVDQNSMEDPSGEDTQDQFSNPR